MANVLSAPGTKPSSPFVTLTVSKRRAAGIAGIAVVLLVGMLGTASYAMGSADDGPRDATSEECMSTSTITSEECMSILDDCLCTGPFVTQVDFSDLHMLQQLVIAIASMTCNVGVLWFHWTHAP